MDKSQLVYFQLLLLRFLAVALSYISIFPHAAFSQIDKKVIERERLRLKLADFYLNVASINQTDMDSCLILASKRSGISSMLFIGEAFDDGTLDKSFIERIYSVQEPGDLKTIVAKRKGTREEGVILGLIGFYYAFRPLNRVAERDSALLYLTRAQKVAESFQDSKLLAQVYLGLGKTHIENQNNEMGDSYFEKSIFLARQSRSPAIEALAFEYWGTFSPFLNETTLLRISRIQTADSLYKSLGKVEHRINALSNIGYLSFASKNLEQSKFAFTEALELEKESGFPYLHYTLDLLAFISTIEGRKGDGVGFALDAERYALSTGDRTIYAHLCMRLNDIYALDGQNIEESINWGLKALEEFKKFDEDRLNLYRTINVLWEMLQEAGRYEEADLHITEIFEQFPPTDPLQKQEILLILAEIYAKTGKREVALKYSQEVEDLQVEVAKQSGDIYYGYFFQRLAFLFYNLGYYEKSRRYFGLMKEHIKEINLATLSDSEWIQSKLDSISGDFLSAYLHLSKHHAFQDSINSLKQSELISNFKIQYESEKKDNDIKVLEQQTALQKAKIESDRFAKTTMLTAVMVLALILGLLYNGFRIKIKSNLILQKQHLEIQRAKQQLEQLLNEKEWLLKEVHHRVKNNLQIVMSLLHTQANYLDSVAAMKAIRESEERIFVISLIHQRLYKSEDNSLINIRDYVLELVSHIKDGLTGTARIKFEYQLDHIMLDVSQMVPLGLILNEAISNSIKYAFGEDGGHIWIGIRESNNGYVLTISDDGAGFPKEFNKSVKPSFGIRLMQGLAKQMGGEFTIESKHGVTVSVSFPDFKSLVGSIIAGADSKETPIDSN